MGAADAVVATSGVGGDVLADVPPYEGKAHDCAIHRSPRDPPDDPGHRGRGGPGRRVPVAPANAASTVHTSPTASGAAAWAARQLRALEREHSARLGAYAHDTATGRTVVYRPDERFPMCSLFKTIGAAAVLRDLDRNGEFLARRIRYTAQYVEASGNSPITGRAENLSHGMTVADLCAYSITHSDNTAANLLLRELGGPGSVTRFCRSIGDPVTRLDRWEPELNSAEPWRETDTTTPRAVGRTYARLVLGDALVPCDRRLLTGWLLANTTSGERFRAELPADWTVADKTAGGSYGGNNNAGIAWPPAARRSSWP